MVQAVAPGMSRAYSRIWLSVAFLALAPSLVAAQGDAKGSAKGAATPPPASGDPAKKLGDSPTSAEAAVVDSTSAKKKNETIELFKDPKTEAALPNTFKEFPSAKLGPTDLTTIKSMAGGGVGPDRGLIQRVIDAQISELTSHANIKAVIEPTPGQNPNAAVVRALERASQVLVDLYNTAKANKNEAFLALYVPALNAKLPPLLEGHLLARIQSAIILALVANPSSIDLFTKQISDPNQVVWVKLWAARGLTNATNGGKTALDVGKATAAVAAIVAFLDSDQDAPWPVKIRMFETLGSLRLPSSTGVNGKPDVTALALQYVSDPKTKVDVRGWAAWSLGMIPVPSSVKLNYAIETYQIGRLAAEVGDRIGVEYDLHKANFSRESDQARYLTALLLYQIYPGLVGEDDIRDSGLLKSRHPGIGPVQPFLKGLDEQLKNLSTASTELLNAGGSQMKDRRATLASRVAELNSFLDKNKPTDDKLTPDGPAFPVSIPKVAVGTNGGK